MIGASAVDFNAWRATARKLLAASVPPDDVAWDSENALLFSEPLPRPAQISVEVPQKFLKAAEAVALHRDPARWTLLYRVLYRITHGEHDPLKIGVDDDVRQLDLFQKAVHRDIHKMKAFVRFRRVTGSEPEQFVAWHRPDHYVVEAVAPWFAERFASMRWSILTPDRSAHWDGQKLGIRLAYRVRKPPTAMCSRSYGANTTVLFSIRLASK